MIHLALIPCEQAEELFPPEQWPEELFRLQREIPLQAWQIYRNGRKLAIADIRIHSGTTAVLMIIPEENRKKEEYAEGINVLTEKILKLFHPQEVLTFTKAPVFRNACIVCRYYPKGRLMRYVPHSWRYRIPDSCFDEEEVAHGQQKAFFLIDSADFLHGATVHNGIARCANGGEYHQEDDGIEINLPIEIPEVLQWHQEAAEENDDHT